VVVLERVPDIEDYLQVAGLGLFTSDSESFCLSILEAMCFGCPSIATRVGGIPEVVEDGVSGVLVAPGDAAALARAVETVISDPAQRIALGEAARHRARTFFGRRHRPPLRGDLPPRLRHRGSAFRPSMTLPTKLNTRSECLDAIGRPKRKHS
jgi:hypothetical protein